MKMLGNQMGHSIGITIPIFQNKQALSRLLAVLLKLSIVKPKNNQNNKKKLGSNLITTRKIHRT